MAKQFVDALEEVSVRFRRAPVPGWTAFAIASRAPPAGPDATPPRIRLIAVSKTFSADHIRAAAASRSNRFRRKQGSGSRTQDRRHRRPCRSAGTSSATCSPTRRARPPRCSTSFTPWTIACWSPPSTRRPRKAGAPLELLIQVDLAGEATKHGVRPDALLPLIDAADSCTAVRLVGLMLLPPARLRP